MSAIETAASEHSRPSARRTPEESFRGNGAAIAFDRIGQGPAVLLSVGALCSRTFGPGAKQAAELARHFTVFTYDRRGRGDSGDHAPYAVEREIEDLVALLQEAGGSAFVYGHDVSAKAIAPVLGEFFGSADSREPLGAPTID